MKTLIVAAIAAASILLTGCASSALVAAAPGKANASAEASAANLAWLKEVNRHLELCDRTYGWPFTAVITCNRPAPPALDADVIGELIDKAIAKAEAARAARADPASPPF